MRRALWLLLSVVVFQTNGWGQETPKSQIILELPVIEPTTNNHNAETNQLQTLIGQKRWDEARQLGEKLALSNSADAGIYFQLGLARLHLQDFVGAVQALRSAERLGLNTAALHKILGLAYYSLDQFDLFEQQTKKALTLNPNDYELYYYLGRYQQSVPNNLVRSIEYYDQVFRLKPDHVKGLYHRGYCKQMIGRIREAQEDYESAIAIIEKTGERFSWPYQSLALLLTDEAPERGLTFAQKAIELEPKLDANYVALAKIYERLGKMKLAADALQSAVRLNPHDASNHFLLGMLYKKLGQLETAKSELMRVQQLKTIYGEQ